MTFWVVGKIIWAEDGSYWNWEIIGIFDDKEKGLVECLSEDYFIGPIILNQADHKTVDWDEAYYPKA